MSAHFEVRVMHDNCGECEVLAAQSVMRAMAMKSGTGFVEYREVPKGKMFPQLMHAAEATRVEDEDWKFVPLHWKCDGCKEIETHAKNVAIKNDSPWGFQSRAAENGDQHSVKAARVL